MTEKRNLVSRHLFPKRLARTFPVRLRREMSRYSVYSLQPPFVCMRMINQLCQSFGALPECHATWHTHE